jgi:hypothetical protein
MRFCLKSGFVTHQHLHRTTTSTITQPLNPISLPTYSTHNPFFLCHPSILSSPYTSCTLFFPSGHLTQAGLLFPNTHTISSTTGNSVSIALANGWISSGHCLSQSQSIVEQVPQKLRSLLHFSSCGVPRDLMALYFLGVLV